MIIGLVSAHFPAWAGETPPDSQRDASATIESVGGGYQAMPSPFVLLARLFTIDFDLRRRRIGP
jgi:hypothetical protein